MRILFFALSIFLTEAASAKEAVYYRAIDQSLPLALKDIAKNFDLSLEARNIPNRRIKGEYRISSPDQFLDSISSRYLLDWFIIDRTLFVTPKNLRERRIFILPTQGELEGFRHSVQHEESLTGTKFPISFDLEQLQVIIQAPETYLRHISLLHKKYINRFANEESDDSYEEESGEGHGVMVFRLKHAWAADKTHQFADATYSISGIATLLQKLTGAKSEEKTGGGLPVLSGQESVLAINPVAAPRRQQAQNQAESQNEAEAGQDDAAAQNTVILADERLNAVLVYDDRKLYGYYKRLIDRLDRKSELVEIEAMIVDVAKNHIHDLGIDWRASEGENAIGFGSLGNNLAEDGAVAVSAGLGGLSTALTSNLSGILAKIKFLETQGESRIVSRPSLVTMDNLEAVINTSQRFFVRITGYQDSSLYPVEVGTTLRVTPHVIYKKQSLRDIPPHIQLFVAIEDGAIDEAESTRVDGLPRIQENKVNTQAVIEQGESLLIGGHIHTTTSDSISRVPILGYIPLLSYLFSSQTTVRKEFIRLFIIRPRVYQ